MEQGLAIMFKDDKCTITNKHGVVVAHSVQSVGSLFQLVQHKDRAPVVEKAMVTHTPSEGDIGL